MLYKFHTNWIHQNGTCFTNILADQKLAIILEKYWLSEKVPNLWREVIWVGEQSGIFSELMKQYKMHLLHNLKILPESNIWPCALINDWMGLKFGGG